MHLKLREPINALTHLIGAVAALIGLLYLVAQSVSSPVKAGIMALYGISLVLMLLSSGLYHAYTGKPSGLLVLRKFDHCAIYLLIAGTYTPVCYQYLSGGWRFWILTIIWAMALIGIGVKLFVIHAPRWVTAGIYLIMGWLALFAIREIVANVPEAGLFWLVAGGIFYTIGALIYISKKPNPFPGVFGFHEIWHIFVLLGAGAHYILVAAFIALLP